MTELFLESADDFFADAVHAADGGDDPDLVAYAHLAVGAAEALEGAGRFFASLRMTAVILRLAEGSHIIQRLVLVVQQALEIGLDAGVVDLGTGRSVGSHVADREAVVKVFEDYLMAAGDVREKGHTLHHLSFRKVLEGDGHVVGGVYLDVLHQKLK